MVPAVASALGQVAISVRCGVQSKSTTGQHMGRDGMDLEDPGSEYSVHVFGHVRVKAGEGHVPSSPKRPVEHMRMTRDFVRRRRNPCNTPAAKPRNTALIRAT